MYRNSDMRSNGVERQSSGALILHVFAILFIHYSAVAKIILTFYSPALLLP